MMLKRLQSIFAEGWRHQAPLTLSLDLGRVVRDKPVLTGRATGQAVRKEVGLNRVSPSCVVTLRVPDTVMGVTSSFWIGLLGTRIVALGSTTAFRQQHMLDMSALNHEVLMAVVERVLACPATLRSSHSLWARCWKSLHA